MSDILENTKPMTHLRCKLWRTNRLNCTLEYFSENGWIIVTSLFWRVNSWTIMIWWTCEWGRYLGFLIGQNLIDPNQLKSVFLHFGIDDDVSDPKYSKLVLDQDQHKLNQSDTRNFHQWIEHAMNLIALGQKLHNEYLIHQEYLLNRGQIQVKWGQKRSKNRIPMVKLKIPGIFFKNEFRTSVTFKL